MKSVFIIGSRKFYTQIENLVQLFKGNKIDASTANKYHLIDDTPDSEKTAILGAFRKIDKSNVCYVYTKNGYVGETTMIEITYAYAKGIELISSCELEGFSIQALISKIMAPKELIGYLIDSEV